MESNLGLGKCLVVVCRYFYLDTAEMIGLCLVLCLCWAHWGGGPHWAQPVPALFYPVLDSSQQHCTVILTATTLSCCRHMKFYCLCSMFQRSGWWISNHNRYPAAGTRDMCWRAVIRADTASTLPALHTDGWGGQRAHYFIQNSSNTRKWLPRNFYQTVHI